MTGERGRRVLVVADSSDALAAAALDSYHVETARTAATALDLLDSEVDALVVEAFLPDRSGEALLETVRERGMGVRAAVLAGPDAAPFPSFDVRVETPTTAEELACAVDRLVSLRAYDAQVDRLYELARRQSQAGGAAPPIGDGGFDAVDEAILDARSAADSALTDVRAEDHERLFVDEATQPTTEDDSR